MKRSKKCFGLLLALSIMLGLSSNVYLEDTSATRYDYQGILFTPFIFELKSEDGKVVPDPLNDGYGGYQLDSAFNIQFKGDSYQPSYDNLETHSSMSFISSRPSNNSCEYYSGPMSIFNVYTDSITGKKVEWTSNNFNTAPVYYPGSTAVTCSKLGEFGGSTEKPSFKISSLPGGFMLCDGSGPSNNGALCGGLWSVDDYIQTQLLPYGYTTRGFYTKSSAVDTNSGLHYDNTFSLSALFNQEIPTFSHLEIPLTRDDDFFYDYHNLYRGREFEAKGVFEFDGNFTWHSNIENNGSFTLNYSGIRLNANFNDSSTLFGSGSVNCTANLRTLPSTGFTQLEYSCPLTLDDDYSAMSFSLVIDGADNYVWTTDDDWRFAATYFVTDNDESTTVKVNTVIDGGGYIPGDARNNFPQNSDNIVINGVDFTSSLTGLFGFNFLNPFSPLFQMFNDNNSCARIPTIAGMIHLENDEVCPWFDSTTRNIVTPVLGIASVMLIFGFAVRWLGSSSGNLFEDSANETIVPPAASPRWGRRKK